MFIYMTSGLKLSSLRLVILVLVIAQGDCQCLQNFDFPGGGFDQNHAIIYDISTCLRCEENTFTILVAGSGVSPAPLTNSTSGVTIIPPSGSEPEYTLMIPVPRDVLSNTVDTIIGCTTGANQEDNRFSELVFGDPVLNPNGTINVIKGTSGSLSCNPSAGTNADGFDSRWTFGSITLATSTDNVIYSFTNIMRNQSGVYNCTLEHSIGSGSAPRYIVTRSAVVTINVQFSPDFTDGLKSSCVGEGKSFSLLLNLEAQPDVGSNFSWTKDGVAYQGNVSSTSLTISNAALGDAGVYNVTASNSLGSDSYSFTLTVTSPPGFALGNDSQIITTTVNAGDNFAVNCTVRNSLPIDCSPVILLTTPQGNVTLTSDPVYTVTNIQSSFDYICIADNGNSISTLTFRISVLPRPTSSSSPSATTDVAPDQGDSIALIIGVVAGVAVIACAISILVPILICCCLGIACFGSIGCLAKNKVKNGQEMKGMFI